MTDNAQELDELQTILFKKLPGDWYYHIDIQGVPQASIHKDAVESIINIISDWHNKQGERMMREFEQNLLKQLEEV